MSLKDQTRLQAVLLEGAGAQPLASATRYAAIAALLENGFAVSVGQRENPVRHDGGPLLVLGNFAGNAPANAGDVHYRDLGDLPAPKLAEAAHAVRTEAGAAKSGDWKPWFPVIDYDRCTNCMQCLSFCLFGVYGVDQQNRIEAQNPDSCKVNCPACSRVCPEAAIMFPKYAGGPINGDVVREADLKAEKIKVDISALLGGDIYALLRQRSERAKSRFSKERDADQALNERKKCLTKLVEVGDIPAEVLMALPSPQEIQRRAEEAKARAQAALTKQAQMQADDASQAPT